MLAHRDQTLNLVKTVKIGNRVFSAKAAATILVKLFTELDLSRCPIMVIH